MSFYLVLVNNQMILELLIDSNIYQYYAIFSNDIHFI